jgi:hypothetical protein
MVNYPCWQVELFCLVAKKMSVVVPVFGIMNIKPMAVVILFQVADASTCVPLTKPLWINRLGQSDVIVNKNMVSGIRLTPCFSELWWDLSN